MESATGRLLEIDLGALEHNVRCLRRLVDPAGVWAVAKAQGYGLGAVQVATAALSAGACGLAVSTTAEALELRSALGPGPRILVMVPVPPGAVADCIRSDLEVSCVDLDHLQMLLDGARGHGPVHLHLKVDTGMSRLGCSPDQAIDLIRRVCAAPLAKLVGIFTHFAAADTDPKFTELQFERFLEVLASAEAIGVDPGTRHAANSAATLCHPHMALDAVRVGLAMYGVDPVPPQGTGLGIRPVVRLQGPIVQVKTLPSGSTVGYQRTWTAHQPVRVAIVSLGYADGLPWSAANRAQAVFMGRRVRILGRVSMDMVCIDIGDLRAVPGDMVTLLGGEGAEAIGPHELASWCGTIAYELLTGIGSRVERRYVRS